MRIPLLGILALLLLCAAACGGKTVSSVEADAERSKAAWSGETERMLDVMNQELLLYAQTDPADPPDRGFYCVNYGHFKLLAVLVPLGGRQGEQGAGGQDDEQTPAPAFGVYGLSVTFDKGLSRYEYLVGKVYDDLAQAFDRQFERVGAPQP